jgi:hypothetical protein
MMMTRADDKVLSAIASLQGNPQFETFHDWLKESHAELMIATTLTKDETLTRWNQGGSQALAEVLAMLRHPTRYK